MLGRSKHASFLPLLVILLFLVGISHAPSFAASSIMVKTSDHGEYCVRIQKAPKRICSFTLDLEYETKALEFSSSSKSNLVQAFTLWDVNSAVVNKPGIIRVGAVGVGSSCVSAGDSGKLVCVEFTKLKRKGNFNVRLENLTGDLAGIKIKRKGGKMPPKGGKEPKGK